MTAQFNEKPIGSRLALSSKLGVGVGELVILSSRVDSLYSRPIPVEKAGKKTRYVYDARPRLRLVQERIRDRILKKLSFQPYLKGGIRGRSHFDSAREHVGANILFGQDVDDFYGMISVAHIRFIFQDVLHFAPDVSQLLARLCSRNGSLVQGGVASTHIANMALHRTEPEYVKMVAALG